MSPGETNWRRERRGAGEQSVKFRKGKKGERRDQRCDREGGDSKEGRGTRQQTGGEEITDGV